MAMSKTKIGLIVGVVFLLLGIVTGIGLVLGLFVVPGKVVM